MNPLKRFATQHLDKNDSCAIHTTPSSEEGEPAIWRDRANCRDQTNAMFPKNYKDITYIPYARSLCRTCPVKSECLEYALEFPAADMHGVWAGLTPRQLAAEQRKRGIKPIRPTLAQMWSK
jgi:hypothetical protein